MRASLSILAVVCAGTLVAAAGQPPLNVDDVLRRAATYVADYERTLPIVAEEQYTQRMSTLQRQLRSEIVFLKDDTYGWVEYRDIAVHDGSRVRDREDRLLELFTRPNPDRLKQAQRIVAEGARFNLNPPGAILNRTLNLPLTALRFLRGPEQYRSQFRIAGSNPVTGTVTLEFTEQKLPRMVGTSDNAAASGWFEVDPATGRVHGSSLRLKTRSVTATMDVTFAADPQIGAWVPVQMNEDYQGYGNNYNRIAVSGTASYSRYRQFRVDTSDNITIKQ